MKKFILTILVISCTFFLFSCGKEKTSSKPSETKSQETPDETNSDSSEDHEYEQLAKKLSEQMAEGKFHPCAELFSDSLKQQLNENGLKTAWTQTVSSAGDYIGYYNSELSRNKASVTVVTTLEYTNTGITVTLTFNEEKKIEGIWLNFRTLTKAVQKENFTETKIQIGRYKLDGLLTLPKNCSNPPVVILVQGSGQTDMDETVENYKPFRDLAYGLADKGIAVIRFHKRFYQHPETSDIITIQTEVLDDVTEAIHFAENCSKINKKQIFILGHSLGGMLAPEIAGKNSNIKGLISLAGSPRKLEDIICDQNKHLLLDNNLSENEITEQMKPILEEAKKIKKLEKDDTGSCFDIPVQYWYSLNQINPAQTAQSLDIPMLFLQGSEDIQVYADIDFAEWKNILRDRPNCTFKLYPGLGHLFIGSEQTVDTIVIEDIAEFIQENLT